MNNLIVGSSGKIGRYLVKYLNGNAIFTYNKHIIKKGIKFDILKDDINKIINKKKFKKLSFFQVYLVLMIVLNTKKCRETLILLVQKN